MPAKAKRAPRGTWTRAKVIEAGLSEIKRTGKMPTANGWRTASKRNPNTSTVLSRFDSWSNFTAELQRLTNGKVAPAKMGRPPKKATAKRGRPSNDTLRIRELEAQLTAAEQENADLKSRGVFARLFSSK